ncbi:MAG: glycosyltransferase [Pseudomonadota bacterium]
MQILHISADFPDPLAPQKTRAVSNLLDLVPEHDHVVYSLNRVAWNHGISALRFDGAHTAVAYGAPSVGVLLETYLRRLAKWIIADAEARRLAPKIVHAHKISIDGLVGDTVARHFGARLIVTSQGNTDTKVLRARPDLRSKWRKIWREAAFVMPMAPWTAAALSDLLGQRAGPVVCLPCPTTQDRIFAPRRAGPVLCSVFGLDDHVNKNAALLIDAARIAAARIPQLRLKIIGTGSASAYAHLSRLIGGDVRISLDGPVTHERIQRVLNECCCLAVPSRRESFGMVFSEALLAGCPVVHGRGNGIAGLYEGAPFARSASRPGAEALAGELVQLVQSEHATKAALMAAQKAGILAPMQREWIGERYRRIIEETVELQSQVSVPAMDRLPA